MNVLEAANKRLDIIFKEFDYVYVSFSGGKDSGALLNLCIDYLKCHDPARHLGVFHMDYECQYQMTTDYVRETLARDDVPLDVYHICVPFRVTTCTSMFQSWWRPWDEAKKDIWIRPLPEGAMTKKDFDFYDESLWDYDFQVRFGDWLLKRRPGDKICCLVGIRTQESLNRWRAVYSDRNYKNYKGWQWTNCDGKGIVNAYPIYDFTVEDVWTANARNGWKYNRLYDLYYMAGVPVNKMRVASPFISEGQESLKLYRVIEPDTWGRLVSRVNGVNFTGIYGGTTAMGWKSIALPKGRTWKDYMFFLLDTLPRKTRDNYLRKLETSMRFWREKGGVLSDDTIAKLESLGIRLDASGASNYRTTKRPVRMEYQDDVDISEFKEIPTYKRMCICIMKNDYFCKYMGFSQTKEEMTRRKNIMEKYKSLL